MSLAAQLADVVTQLGALRNAALADYDGPQQRFLVEAIDGAIAQLSQAVMTATSNKPPSPLVLAIEKAERAGDHERADVLLEQARDDAAVIAGDGFCVVPAAKNA